MDFHQSSSGLYDFDDTDTDLSSLLALHPTSPLLYEIDMDMDASPPKLPPFFFFDAFDLEALLLPFLLQTYIGLSHLNLSFDDELSCLPHLPPQLKSSEWSSLPQPELPHPLFESDSQSLPDSGIHLMGREYDLDVLDLNFLDLCALAALG